MSAYPAHEVPIDVLPPIPKHAPLPPRQDPVATPPPFDGLRTFYHPASGVVILGLDWLVFGTDLFTGFLAMPIMCVLAFLSSFVALMSIQTKWSRDSIPTAMGKAFLGAFLVALPFPITGTLMGAAILGLAGLPHHPVDAVKRAVASQIKQPVR